MTADADSFLLTDTLDAYEGDQRVFAKRWSKSHPATATVAVLDDARSSRPPQRAAAGRTRPSGRTKTGASFC